VVSVGVGKWPTTTGISDDAGWRLGSAMEEKERETHNVHSTADLREAQGGKREKVGAREEEGG